MRRLTYKSAGVDIYAADRFVSRIRGRKRKNEPAAFASLFPLNRVLSRYRIPYLVSSCDGVGTKLKIARELGVHNTVGIDLVAMNVNDIVCLGARPLFFLDYIACGKVNPDVLEEVVKGIKRGLAQAGCLLVGGETAEMPGMYDKDEYDLAGFCVGVVDKTRVIDGTGIRRGDVIIGLASSGIHSNGYSLVRKVFSRAEIKKYAKDLLKPTRIYVKPVLELLNSRLSAERCPLVKGIAHITGGAFYNKATKILPPGLCMVIERRRWRVPEIFKLIQSKGNIDDKQMYTVFNMGIGMVVVAAQDKATSILEFMKKQAVSAYLIGEIVRGKEKIKLV